MLHQHCTFPAGQVKESAHPLTEQPAIYSKNLSACKLLHILGVCPVKEIAKSLASSRACLEGRRGERGVCPHYNLTTMGSVRDIKLFEKIILHGLHLVSSISFCG